MNWLQRTIPLELDQAPWVQGFTHPCSWQLHFNSHDCLAEHLLGSPPFCFYLSPVSCSYNFVVIGQKPPAQTWGDSCSLLVLSFLFPCRGCINELSGSSSHHLSPPQGSLYTKLHKILLVIFTHISSGPYCREKYQNYPKFFPLKHLCS